MSNLVEVSQPISPEAYQPTPMDMARRRLPFVNEPVEPGGPIQWSPYDLEVGLPDYEVHLVWKQDLRRGKAVVDLAGKPLFAPEAMFVSPDETRRRPVIDEIERRGGAGRAVSRRIVNSTANAGVEMKRYNSHTVVVDNLTPERVFKVAIDLQRNYRQKLINDGRLGT